jgi:hypothetical protein
VAWDTVRTPCCLPHREAGLNRNHPAWPEIATIARRFGAIETVSTRFSRVELNNAKFLGIVARFIRGYPEPAAKHGFLPASYDLTSYCNHCGLGKHQVASFRVKAIPVIKKNTVMQLNWVFDEFFTSTETWADVFEPVGIGARPILLDGTGAKIESVVQLAITREFELKLDGMQHEVCRFCLRPKYAPSLRGYFPQPIQADAMIFKSSQYFGSGAGAWQLALVSKAMYRRIRDAGLKGLDFYPSID